MNLIDLLVDDYIYSDIYNANRKCGLNTIFIGKLFSWVGTQCTIYNCNYL